MSIYLGRIVAVGLTKSGKAAAMYRVSSRSFPNREAVINGEQIAIVPRAGFESDLKKNPYIAYNCVRPAGKYIIASNGSQTDPITEKIQMGMPVRDAVALGLLAMDYEKDSLDTPRIVAVIGNGDKSGVLGIIRKNALLVREVELQPGQSIHLSTYEHNYVCEQFADNAFAAETAAEACEYVLGQGAFAEFPHAVSAACAVACSKGFDLAVRNA